MASKNPVQHQRKSLVLDTWFLEIGAATLSICSFIVILVLLLHYNGRPQFEFHGVTLNAIVSVLATIARIGLVVPVAESLAQWKWMWFSKGPRSLADFESIDDASRGSRGSFLLLWEKKSWSITSIGAWIILLSAAIEPFFQQIITYENAVMYRDDGDVQIPLATRWDGGTEIPSPPTNFYTSSNGINQVILKVAGYGSVLDVQLDLSAQAAVLYGLSADQSHVIQQLTTSCPSGNCTWPPYLSLAVCSACSDVTSMVSRVSKYDYPSEWAFPSTTGYDYQYPANLTSFNLPNGVNLDNRNPGSENIDSALPVLMTAHSSLKPSQSINFKDHTTLLFSISVLRVPLSAYPIDGMWVDPQNVPINATECGMYLCVKKYQSRLENGVLLMTSNEVSAQRSKESFQVALYEDQNSIQYINNINPDVDALYSNTTFFPRTDLMIDVPPGTSSANSLKGVNVTQAGIDGLTSYISSLFDAGTFDNRDLPVNNVTQCTLDGSSHPCGHIRNITGMVIGNINSSIYNVGNYAPPVMQVLWDSSDLANMFSKLAESITIEMRKTSQGQPTVTGQLGSIETLLKVRWPWITLPFFCLCVSLCFLIMSIWEAHHDETPLWKSSAMATLYHGLDAKTRQAVEHSTLPSHMSREAEEIKVQLSKDHDGVLMLRHDSVEGQKPQPAKAERPTLDSPHNA